MKTRFAVATLAEFVHRRGDLHARLDGRTRAEEGISVQRKLQGRRAGSYERERAVTLVRDIAGERVTIGGRIDGCDVQARLLEEYKTTRADPDEAHAHHASAHWAQVQLYGALLVHELAADTRTDVDSSWTLRLIYCHPDTLATRTFERSASNAQLGEFLEATLAWLDAWLACQRAHEHARDRALDALQFPYADYRPHQRALARRAYQALRDREQLLLEAPTGSGKTIGLLYPAVKALATTDHEKVFFLTSRNTGASAAVAGCEQLDPDQAYLRYVHVVNKQQACLVEGMPCDPVRCQYANGYFDRVHDAVRELLSERAMGPEQVRTVAERHRVCPFELSLDAGLWADVLIGDYNYVFDPVVHLQRFADNPNIALLVDESHQLSARGREMLSLTLSRSSVRRALKESMPTALLRRVRAIDRNLVTLKRNAAVTDEQVVAKPEALLRAVARLADELAGSDLSLEGLPHTRELVMDCFRWVRSQAWYDNARCLHIARVAGREFTLKRVHLDPGPYLQQKLAAFGAHIRFSGTVSPLLLYQKLHGVAEGASARAGSPFADAQLEALIVGDVPTFWRSRTSSMGKLVRLIDDVVTARAGNYLVALPSFEYLNAVAQAIGEWCPRWRLLLQTPGMTPDERAAFVTQFRDTAAGSVGLVVLGGVFAESVDFSADAGRSAIAGVICVGIGLPPPTLERKALAAYFDERGDDGYTVAFRQPAMTKVLQMAGRLLRHPGDRGVLCLVDPRFNDPAYQRFFPAHWQPRQVAAGEISRRLEKFWQAATGSPRLRASSHASQSGTRCTELNGGVAPISP